MKDSADMDEAAGMDPRDAAAIMQQAREHADRELNVRHPVIFAAWALVYLLGYGAIWLSVRGQRPYQAPAGWALAVLALLAVAALGVTAMVTDRAISGVGGPSALKRRIYWLSIAIGLLGLYIMEAALRYNGVSRGVIGVVTASGPLLVAGVVLVAGTAAWLNWYMFGLGVWLIAVAAFSGFAGPVGVWAVDALAVGIPFLVMAAIRIRRKLGMSDDGLDPVIHAPARLRLMVTLAALPGGDTLSFTRLQDLIGLTPGNLITHLRKLEDAGYVQMEKTGSGVNALTTVALTQDGRAALERYTAVLRQLLDTAGPTQSR